MSSQSPGKLVSFWNQNSSSHSKLLWLPTNGNLNPVNKNNYDNSLIKLSQNTWFHVNEFNFKIQEGYKLPFPNKNKQKPENLIKCKKIQLFPTSEQQKTLNN